ALPTYGMGTASTVGRSLERLSFACGGGRHLRQPHAWREHARSRSVKIGYDQRGDQYKRTSFASIERRSVRDFLADEPGGTSTVGARDARQDGQRSCGVFFCAYAPCPACVTICAG